ncbi:CocE/NonD family hydrolase [Lentzea sp. BCCO 10_0856]|uniref:CocE/NonD family hydrolase n=1 Tax=Lentzea miocenica TaxID=3095431 RepID=A0ABU4T374_9PSEU|nr:CocE/NonD family hydrolase [Lentzea sp. BCCO 10_0856]MDX8032617.1 CocE/NonD family hydrolase [Lentzea sp. BCCO 10_0856]
MTKSPGLFTRVVSAVHRRATGLPPGAVPYTVERGIRVPTGDGAQLVTDLYLPDGDARGTVLIRSPYGRGLPESLFHGRAFADHGYQVVIQSVRGTGGSTGTFRPIAQETSDSHDTVAWLREQSWFSGRLATLGGSYLGWTQWALMRDPPPELRAAVVLVGPHDFSRAIRGTGSLALADFLGWSANVKALNSGGMSAMVTAGRRVTAALHEPTPELAAAAALGDEPTWFDEWLAHPDLADPFWQQYDATSVLGTTTVPTLLIGGWHDVFVDQTLEQFRSLESRQADVAMTIGPWTHLDTTVKAARVADTEALAWFDEHVGGLERAREAAVRVYLTGAEQWRTLPTWPPSTTELTLTLDASRLLSTEPGSGTVEFGYDPSDPTPSLGGRHMSAKAGRQDNRSIERRADVITFTSTALGQPLDVVGAPRVTLQLKVTGAAPDLFVRLCEVDARGRSWNVTEAFIRFDPTGGHVELPLGSCAHRFRAGHRVRLQISGGAYPRFARNPEPSHYTVDCAGSALSLPVE